MLVNVWGCSNVGDVSGNNGRKHTGECNERVILVREPCTNGEGREVNWSYVEILLVIVVVVVEVIVEITVVIVIFIFLTLARLSVDR